MFSIRAKTWQTACVITYFILKWLKFWSVVKMSLLWDYCIMSANIDMAIL